MNWKNIILLILSIYIIDKLFLCKTNEKFRKGPPTRSITDGNFFSDMWEGATQDFRDKWKIGGQNVDSGLVENEQIQGIIDNANRPKFYLQNLATGKCAAPLNNRLFPKDGTLLGFGNNCGEMQTMFTQDDNGVLRHISGKCVSVHYNGAWNGTPLELSSTYCDQPFDFLRGGSLHHKNSGRCIHPEGGWAEDDVKLVAWDGCAWDNKDARISLVPIDLPNVLVPGGQAKIDLSPKVGE